MKTIKKIEDLKKPLYELKAQTQSISETGQMEAEAKAQSNTVRIEQESKIYIAKNNKELQNLKNKFESEMESLKHSINLNYEKDKNFLLINEKEKLSNIETLKFERIIQTIGQDTLVNISKAGPESQVKLLQALGLEGFIMTEGNSPINLFNFANNIAKS